MDPIEEPKKIGWGIEPAILRGVAAMEANLGKSNLKATMVEAALLDFFGQPRDRQLELLQNVERHQLNRSLHQAVAEAIMRDPRNRLTHQHLKAAAFDLLQNPRLAAKVAADPHVTQKEDERIGGSCGRFTRLHPR